MGHRKALVRQGVEELLAMAAYGQSKHLDKQENQGFPAREKIYSSVTMDNYIDYCMRFLRWAQETHNCRYLDEAREHVGEYLELRKQTMSAWTVRAEAAGIAKLYQCGMHDFGVELPVRSRDDITQHREDRWIKHFAPERHKDMLDFGNASGLRRHELEAVTPDDVWEEDGQTYVFVKSGKGGKTRTVPCLNSDPLRIAQEAAAAGKTVIFDHIHSRAPIHQLRAAYAKTAYAILARPLEEIPLEERYICRGSKNGIIYDKKALAAVSKALGHQRLDVIADNYLYALPEHPCI